MDENAMNEANEAEFNDAFEEDETMSPPSPENQPENNNPEESNTKVEQKAPETKQENGNADPGNEKIESSENGEMDNDYSDLFGENTDQKPEEHKKSETEKQETDVKDKGLSYDDIFSSLPNEYNGINVREFAEMYPEEAKTAASVAEIVARKILEDRAGNPASDFSQRLDQLEQVIRQNSVNQAQENYNRAVLEKHPDAREIVSRDAKFKEWLKGQSSGIKKLFLESSDPQDACMILDMYKSTSKNGVAPAKRSAYAGSGRGGARPNPTGRTSEDEFNDGWETDK